MPADKSMQVEKRTSEEKRVSSREKNTSRKEDASRGKKLTLKMLWQRGYKKKRVCKRTKVC
jgi:hypothetical protein